MFYYDFMGKVHFFTFFIGANLTFFPMHFLGFCGMPRRIPDYPDYFFKWNMVFSFGSMLSGVATIYFFLMFINIFVVRKFFNINGWYSFIVLAFNLVHIFIFRKSDLKLNTNINKE